MLLNGPLKKAATLTGVELSDEEVVGRVLSGDAGLFELLIRRHNQRVYRTTRGILKADADAEDAVQQTWVLAYTRLAQFAGSARFSTWLTSIAVNESLGRLRKQRRLRVVTADEPAFVDESPAEPVPGSDPERHTAMRELSQLVSAALDDLPRSQRVVFVLREAEGLSGAETADALGISETAVKVRLHRAKARLRESLDEQLGEAARHTWPFAGTRCDRTVAKVFARLGLTRARI